MRGTRKIVCLGFRLTRPAVLACPEWALWAGLPVRIVNTFFMRTSHDAFRPDDGFHSVASDELVNFGADDSILPNVLVLRKPAFQRLRLAAILDDDSDCNFGCPLIVWPVPRYGGDRKTLKAAPGFLLQRGTTLESHAVPWCTRTRNFFNVANLVAKQSAK